MSLLNLPDFGGALASLQRQALEHAYGDCLRDSASRGMSATHQSYLQQASIRNEIILLDKAQARNREVEDIRVNPLAALEYASKPFGDCFAAPQKQPSKSKKFGSSKKFKSIYVMRAKYKESQELRLFELEKESKKIKKLLGV